MIYESNYKKLEKLKIIEQLTDSNCLTLRSNGYMDLVIELLESNTDYVTISMAHYFEQNGDLMADPEMMIKIYKTGMCEALSYRMDSIRTEQYVYKTVDGKEYVNIKLKKTLNSFLSDWLTNLINQKF